MVGDGVWCWVLVMVLVWRQPDAAGPIAAILRFNTVTTTPAFECEKSSMAQGTAKHSGISCVFDLLLLWGCFFFSSLPSFALTEDVRLRLQTDAVKEDGARQRGGTAERKEE